VSFDIADAAYEWMMGQYSDEGTRAGKTWTKLLSDDLADAFGTYVNGLDLRDAEGEPLVLDQREDGSYTTGSYYDYLVDIVADAAGDYLSRTEFPLTIVPMQGTRRVFPGDAMLAQTVAAESAASEGDAAAGASTGVRQVQATVYDTIESYVSSLNGQERWLTYNARLGIADVTGLWGYVGACRMPSQDVCAYDALDRSGIANQLFGTDESASLHFDPVVGGLLEASHERYAQAEGWDEELVAAWRGDLTETDALDQTVVDRVTMMDPQAHLLEEGCVKAAHWRINTGLFQSNTTLAGEVNLARSLAACEQVEDVSFEAVWEAGFCLAERSGDPEGQLVAWMCDCCPQEADAADEPSSTEQATGDEQEENN